MAWIDDGRKELNLKVVWAAPGLAELRIWARSTGRLRAEVYLPDGRSIAVGDEQDTPFHVVAFEMGKLREHAVVMMLYSLPDAGDAREIALRGADGVVVVAGGPALDVAPAVIMRDKPLDAVKEIFRAVLASWQPVS
ncbi:MAG TPA: hypothetical protein VGO62_11340 [Myxococcota bacterium]